MKFKIIGIRFLVHIGPIFNINIGSVEILCDAHSIRGQEPVGQGWGRTPSLTARPRFSEECVSCLSLFVSWTASEAPLFADSLFLHRSTARQNECRGSGAPGLVSNRQNPQIFSQLAKVAHIPALACVYLGQRSTVVAPAGMFHGVLTLSMHLLAVLSWSRPRSVSAEVVFTATLNVFFYFYFHTVVHYKAQFT